MEKSAERKKTADNVVEEAIKRHGSFLIPILQDIQEYYNFLPKEALEKLSVKLNVSLTDIHGVATFYRSFSLVPKGKHIVTVCMGTACHVRGGSRIVDALSRKLGIEAGETTSDMQFSLETVNCLGCCAIGPVAAIDSEYYGEMTSQKMLSILKDIGEGVKDGKTS